jgi:RNA recognition motif-containing protein
MSRLYVGNLPDGLTEKALEEFFHAARHPVEGIKLIPDVDTGFP